MSPSRTTKQCRTKSEARFKCKYCPRWFKNHSGLTQHTNVYHLDEANPRIGYPPAQKDSDSGLDTGALRAEIQDNVFGMKIFDSGSDISIVDNDSTSSPDASVLLDFDDEAELADTTDVPLNQHEDDRLRSERHPKLTGSPCDESGRYLPSGAPPHSQSTPLHEKWVPFRDQVQFELADILYRRNQMSQKQVDDFMALWAASLRAADPNARPPFANHQDLLDVIDSIDHGEAAWDQFTVSYSGPLPAIDPPSWMQQKYDVCFRDVKTVIRNIMKNRDFDGQFDYSPYREYRGSKRRYKNFMSGDWAWRQADIISKLPSSEGCLFVPLVAGSDKTTVSVATGQNEYYPLYVSIGNVHNSVRRAHRSALIVVAFLSIPKSDRKYDNDVRYRNHRRQIFHSSLSKIFGPLLSSMTTPEVFLCPDGHRRRVIFGLGPYIADYPEQVLLAIVLTGWCPRCLSIHSNLDTFSAWRNRGHTEFVCKLFNSKYVGEKYGIVRDVVPFTNDFPRADIHELLAPDLLHQIIKGTFKDHLVAFVEDFLVLAYGPSGAKMILDDIDHRLALVPPFSNLRSFPQGRRFKQWTGDDSKALMKIYIPAIAGHLPVNVIKTFRAFLDFCYLVRRDMQDEDTLAMINAAIIDFHHYREIFRESGVRPKGFSLPRQHAMTHYYDLIKDFGAPNGLCSSITESKHIEAVKKPWRRSNRYHALKQMLCANERQDKLLAARAYFESEGMLKDVQTLGLECVSGSLAASATIAQTINPHSNQTEPDDDDDDVVVEGPKVLATVKLPVTPQRGYSNTIEGLTEELSIDNLHFLSRKFLFYQLHPNASSEDKSNLLPDFYPDLAVKVNVFHSAYATFYAPSDPSGTGGMRREIIRSCRSWRKGPPRYDTVFVETDANLPGMRGLRIARVFLLFSFVLDHVQYSCALIQWFETIDDEPDEESGMWIVAPMFAEDDSPLYDVVHVESILRAAHLIPVFGEDFVAEAHELDSSLTLDNFSSFYVNKYIDHHAHEIVF